VSAAPKHKDLSFLSCQVAETFSKLGLTKQIWIGQKTLLPDSFFSSFRPAIAELTHRGKRKIHHEFIDSVQNDSSTGKKIKRPIAIAARFSSHPTIARLRSACADGSSAA
jgi:hypothetical protein